MPTARVRGRRVRRQAPGKYRLIKPTWVDPYPGIVGTNPEKRIFEALMRRGQYFIYHGGSPSMVKQIHPFETDHDIDFLLPEYRVILDPFDPYGHSQLSSVVRDSRKRALFAEAGYVTYYMWVVKPGVFVLDEWQPIAAVYSRRMKPEVKYNTKTRRWELKTRTTPKVPHLTCYGADDLLNALPLLNVPPQYPLTDPADQLAKANFGYRIGSHYGTGAGAVAAANHARARPPRVSIQLGTRSLGRTSGGKQGL